jgi:hypothetical protein
MKTEINIVQWVENTMAVHLIEMSRVLQRRKSLPQLNE